MTRVSTAILAAALCAASVGNAQGTIWSAGAAAGQLKFSDGAKESAVGATISVHVWDWLDVSVNPTYAWSQSVALQTGPTVVVPARRVSGFTDLPVSFGVSRALGGRWAPSVGFSLGVTLPTGDPATVGSGQANFGASASVGVAPSDDLWFSAGAGRSLSDGYSAALASSSSTSVALSAGTSAGVLRLSASVSGDVGAVPAGFAPARSVAAGIAAPLGGGMSILFDGSVGLSKGSPAWAYSVGLGTTMSGLAAASVAPYQRLNKAFGAGTASKSKTKPTK